MLVDGKSGERQEPNQAKEQDQHEMHRFEKKQSSHRTMCKFFPTLPSDVPRFTNIEGPNFPPSQHTHEQPMSNKIKVRTNLWQCHQLQVVAVPKLFVVHAVGDVLDVQDLDGVALEQRIQNTVHLST